MRILGVLGNSTREVSQSPSTGDHERRDGGQAGNRRKTACQAYNLQYYQNNGISIYQNVYIHTHILYIVDIYAVLPVKNKNKDKKQDRNTQIFILKKYAYSQ